MKNNNLSIDIIMPNFNKARYLKEAIESVINQTYKNWKLYIIDDCSSDKSDEIINKFRQKNKIKYVKLKKNKGPSFCRNIGIRISDSNYISFLDSDDYWVKNKLEDQINFMNKNNFSFTYTDYIPFIQKNDNKKFLEKTSLKSSFNFNEFTLNSSINTTTMIVSRSLIKNLKFKKIKKLEDYLFKCQILKQSKIAYKFNSTSAFYRILDKSRSSQRLHNILYLWKINQKYNNFSIFRNLFSIFMISVNSIKKYGFK
ncbi:MAG: hypothetical protein CMF96_12075 [Candidatus Marinimicrobia bacterium]|nr:hypothetical protein [Candidatus Neomarinimicrobiota bacterium]